MNIYQWTAVGNTWSMYNWLGLDKCLTQHCTISFTFNVWNFSLSIFFKTTAIINFTSTINTVTFLFSNREVKSLSLTYILPGIKKFIRAGVWLRGKDAAWDTTIPYGRARAGVLALFLTAVPFNAHPGGQQGLTRLFGLLQSHRGCGLSSQLLA